VGMLPLKAFVNALQYTLRNPNGLIRALALPGVALKHYDTGLTPEETPDRLDVKLPQLSNFRRSVMALHRGGNPI
jgi:hypothetical protein